MTGKVVTLTPLQECIAQIVGLARHKSARKRGSRDAHGFDGSRVWDVDIEGAAAEYAVALLLDRSWDGAIEQDVAGYQVRSTKHEDGRLIIRPRDPSAIFILVVGKTPRFRVAGWIHSRTARRDEWKTPFGNDRPEVWAVPQSELRSIEELERRNEYTATLPIESDNPVQTPGPGCV